MEPGVKDRGLLVIGALSVVSEYSVLVAPLKRTIPVEVEGTVAVP